MLSPRRVVRSLLLPVLPCLVSACAVAPWSAQVDDAQGGPPGQAPAPLEDYAILYRKFELALGGALYANFDTSVQVTDTDSGLGAHIDLEDTLDVDKDLSTGRLDGQWGINRRSRLNFALYDISRTGRRAIVDEDLEFGDIVIPGGTSVNTRFGTEIFKLAYQYNFVADQRTTIGVTAGFHTMNLDMELATAVGNTKETFKAVAPLPVVGLHMAYALNQRMRLSAGSELLQVDLGDLRGAVADSRITFEHDPFEHFGWGLGINNFALTLEVDGDDDLRGDFEYGYSGLLLYLRTFF